MSDDQTILIFGDMSNEFGLLDEQRQVKLPIETLRANLSAFAAALQDILSAADTAISDMKLTSIDVAVGVNGKGQVGFLGTGAEVGGNATLKLTFQRS